MLYRFIGNECSIYYGIQRSNVITPSPSGEGRGGVKLALIDRPRRSLRALRDSGGMQCLQTSAHVEVSVKIQPIAILKNIFTNRKISI